LKVAVIGAGPAGITAARRISGSGTPVVVYEKEHQVGGLSRTISLWGQKVDLGPHRFFTTQRRALAMWSQAVADKYCLVNRQTRILYRNCLFDYPLRPANVLANLGWIDSGLSFLSYCREKTPFQSTNGATFEAWVTRRFGRRLYEKFFKTYSEKLWGIPCSELDSDFAAQRIRGFNLWDAIKSAVQPEENREENEHRTLAAEFAYPKGGAGMAYEQMAEAVRRSTGLVRTECEVKAVMRKNNVVQGVLLADGTFQPYNHVISTMDLKSLLCGLRPLPDDVEESISRLSYRNTILVYLHIDSDRLFPDQWIYVHSPDLEVGRITNFRNWAPELYAGKTTTIVALEYWCYDQDAIWTTPDADLVKRATREFAHSGLLKNATVLAGSVMRIQGSYPVYRVGYKELLKPIIQFLKKLDGLTVIGRSACFKYNNQDHSMLMGILAAENLLLGASHDLWSINTDSDYQEAGTAFSRQTSQNSDQQMIA
jgi:protoporphyrinogen oxidase